MSNYLQILFIMSFVFADSISAAPVQFQNEGFRLINF